MNCVEAKKLLQLYMDNELSARESLDVKNHLDACPSCTSMVDYFIRQDEALRAYAKAEAGDNSALRAEIRQLIQQPSQAADRPSPRAWWQRPALRRIAAVLVVALVIGFFFLRGSTPFNEKVYADAVADHDHHCTLEKLRRAVSIREELDRLTASYSKLESTPDLSAYGYAEPRAVICRLNGQRMIHIVYQSQSQKPLSLFMRLREEELVPADLLELHRDDHTIVSLSHNDTDLVVVAALDEAQTSVIARAIASQFTN